MTEFCKGCGHQIDDTWKISVFEDRGPGCNEELYIGYDCQICGFLERW